MTDVGTKTFLSIGIRLQSAGISSGSGSDYVDVVVARLRSAPFASSHPVAQLVKKGEARKGKRNRKNGMRKRNEKLKIGKK